MITVLGVDLGPGRWANNGSAVISFDLAGPDWRTAELGVVDWPRSDSLTPQRMGAAIDGFARERGIAAVSIDGPQGWRHPHAPLDRPGVGRVCEKSARTPGKTGTEGTTYPASQLGWIQFSIALFDELLRLPHTDLANDPAAVPLTPPPAGHYMVLECFPTSTWRSNGLQPLPAKRKHPDLDLHATAISNAFALPLASKATSHDDLQALVAALSAAALFGAAQPIAHGEPAHLIDLEGRPLRVEGIIWDATPLSLIAPEGRK